MKTQGASGPGDSDTRQKKDQLMTDPTVKEPLEWGQVPSTEADVMWNQDQPRLRTRSVMTGKTEKTNSSFSKVSWKHLILVALLGLLLCERLVMCGTQSDAAICCRSGGFPPLFPKQFNSCRNKGEISILIYLLMC
ncbi:uncharacterized protein LOC144287573 isoform X1 [Canis aureus]